MNRKNKFKIVVLLLLATISVSFIISKSKSKPTLFLIGDSTVRNGTLGNGGGGLWGWGSFLNERIDTFKISIQNRAMGGTSSHSYTATGLWDKVLKDIKPGDFVIMQFGHNDNGKSAVSGTGDDTIHVINPRSKKEEIVHSFGWNMRKYILETKAKGATPIICSLVPRNRWKDNRVIRDQTHAIWAKTVADEEGVLFIDLNTIIANHYDQLGQDQVMGKYFTEKDAVHTIKEGAVESSILVAEGLRMLKRNPLKKYMLPY
jgi:lysophospholipase L1-like esterase